MHRQTNTCTYDKLQISLCECDDSHPVAQTATLHKMKEQSWARNSLIATGFRCRLLEGQIARRFMVILESCLFIVEEGTIPNWRLGDHQP